MTLHAGGPQNVRGTNIGSRLERNVGARKLPEQSKEQNHARAQHAAEARPDQVHQAAIKDSHPQVKKFYGRYGAFLPRNMGGRPPAS